MLDAYRIANHALSQNAQNYSKMGDWADKNITDAIIAKNRNGPTGTIPVYFHKEYVRFQDLAKD